MRDVLGQSSTHTQINPEFGTNAHKQTESVGVKEIFSKLSTRAIDTLHLL